MKDVANYYGRLVPQDELPVEFLGLAKSLPTMFKQNGKWSCQRCHSRIKDNWSLPDKTFYCRACLVFGRLVSDQLLYYLPQEPFTRGDFLVWQGQLTPYQAQVSEELQKAIDKKENILVHAVTGAGKTEMIYRPLASLLNQGKSVAVVSPRIDVCIELYHRLTRDFSCPISLLHGESEAYERSPLVIATIHQLFKFYQAFDVIIIDEVDAFPFVDNDFLYRAVALALKPDGNKIFLTATSTDRLDRAVKTGQLRRVQLARRFHDSPLVVPSLTWLDDLLENMKQKRLPKKLLEIIERQQLTSYPLLIFFPHIQLGQEFYRLLIDFLPDKKIGFVSSQTPERKDLVEQFRQGDLDVLISTTILERGVTFPCVDVFVLWCNHKLYTRSSLVQISGRVGRSQERPTGQLIFFHNGKTKAIVAAIKEIKAMNQVGGF
ncbi:DEAD/DEAH box helicase [Streptococcus sp. sy018]|uniref:DEAD/DEAH box helicase n=1 Tax=Streptococcus sp. sy018 TaxID=2600147 RepID=UPI0011B6C798|nr:DEAD/DEAH box helicase [Streptococcus sp. sy018]TWS94410.1 DEAD/DEAH box helicase [Streptococcus sp. sy018]